MSEGIHLDSRALRFLTDLVQIQEELKNANTLVARLTAHQLLTRRQAKEHCRQAGISWDGFKAPLEHRKGR